MDSKEFTVANSATVVAVTGARGFIGKRLISEMLGRGDIKVRALVRGCDHGLGSHPNLTVVVGDLALIETLSGFLLPGCTLINMAYDFSATSAANLKSAENLVKAASDCNIARLIHCSTASVYGRVSASKVTEDTVCGPISEYGQNKLEIERIFKDGALGKFDFVNIRPTSVFGSGGPALKKLIANLGSRSTILNYLNSCLFNYRALNLVSVETVLAAVVFILNNDRPEINGEIFIISQDDEVGNNFTTVESRLNKMIYGRQYVVPVVPIPLFFLGFVLRMLGRDNIDPARIFDAKKLASRGFKSPKPFLQSLDEFADAYGSD